MIITRSSMATGRDPKAGKVAPRTWAGSYASGQASRVRARVA